MLKIDEVVPGKAFACKFKVLTMLDTFGRPNGLSDVPLAGPGDYEGFGLIKVRDMESKQVRVIDQASGKEFIVSFDNIWDIDEAIYEPESPKEEKDGTTFILKQKDK
tara:strand:- start:841 stop:1161 length:321 start_codon:yes stop_codon:yes gene_type:complete